ncbi:UPF0481 protein At3g47200-like [Oryza brachyantha]|nr:UPF0481 protein At3g47200-like [Oryza brachyantha]
MEMEKWICLDYILKLNRDVSLHEYLSLISGQEKQVRGCYNEDIDMDSKEFMRMVLLDSCFILVYLGGMHGLCREENTQEASVGDPATQENGDPMEWYNSSAIYDLLLLENQIPFFIIRTIYQLFSRDTVATTALLTSDISEFMEGILYHFPKVITEANRPRDFSHLLHLCHMYLKPSHKLEDEQHRGQSGKSHYLEYISDFCRKVFCLGQEQNMFHELNELKSPININRWRRAVDYHEAGIEFKKREFDEDDPHSLLDIRFRKGVTEIPCLPIDDKSSLLFRNLVSLEQTCPQFGDDITAYIGFMSAIISTASDVAFLAQKGIIVHQMESDEEVSTLFTKLFEHVSFDFNGEQYLRSLFYAMDAHYQRRVNRWMAWLWHKHFSNPWLGFAAITSVFIVLCSIMQTVLAFLSYT